MLRFAYEKCYIRMRWYYNCDRSTLINVFKQDRFKKRIFIKLSREALLLGSLHNLSCSKVLFLIKYCSFIVQNLRQTCF